MKSNLVTAAFLVSLLAITTTVMARGPGVGAGNFGSSPAAGGFGYQGPQFGYQGPAFGDSRTSTYGTPGNRGYGTASPPPGTGTLQRTPDAPGHTPAQDPRIEPRETDY